MIGIIDMHANFVNGYYRDSLSNPKRLTLWKSGWCANLVVRSCNVLLATLMKRHEGMQGILHLAVGEGEDKWDGSRPRPQLTTTQLAKEVARQALGMDQIVYLDNAYEPTENPSKRLQVTAELRAEDINRNGNSTLREFALFGGDATIEPGSGFMINHVIHPKIELTEELTLIRKVRLDFVASIDPTQDLSGFGSTLPVMSIDGVGGRYADMLENKGVRTLDDLLKMDPLAPVGTIPLVRLREFRAKARIVLQTRVNLDPFKKLADQNISRVLKENPEKLAGLIGAPAITPEKIACMQEGLAPLQVALDDSQLRKITIGDLLDM